MKCINLNRLFVFIIRRGAGPRLLLAAVAAFAILAGAVFAGATAVVAWAFAVN